MLLENINYSPGADGMQATFDKINQAIDTINSVLGGGSAGSLIVKSSNADFDFEFKNIKNSVKQSARSVFGGANTVFESAVLTTPADSVRDNFIFVSAQLQNGGLLAGTLELFRNGTSIQTVPFSMADDASSNPQNFMLNWHFGELEKSPGIAYKVRITTATSSNVPQLIISMDSSI